MTKLILLSGLPGSGKTTRALALLQEYPGAVRVNRDLLREMLHGKIWSLSKELITRESAATLVRMLLGWKDAGVGISAVIIDDTNLAPAVVGRWQALAQECGAEYEDIRMETALDICIERDTQRKESVGRSVIVGMALQYGLYSKPHEGIVLCDIDGTLANVEHRLHYIQADPKNWQGFFNAMEQDTPREDIIALVAEYQQRGHTIFLVSGRPDIYRETTVAWLLKHCPALRYEALFMRRYGDYRPDTVVKAEILARYFPDPGWIHVAIDDRPSILGVWSAQGIAILDVGKGADF